MSECDEVAAVLLARCPPLQSLDAARVYVRSQMLPGESEVIIDNVAWSLWRDYVAAHGPATEVKS